ncbi:MAG: hypothetical protein KDJ17_00700 [Hyphomicrobiaceae bacterium]|nr:hypothetical protein [Hyphomicrobiaceae bacterium]
MSSDFTNPRGPTSPAHDFYEVLFQGADIASSFWQPALKAAGRWQLEIAHLAARQMRASMALGTDLLHAKSSSQLTSAYRNYWDELSHSYTEANRNISNAFSRPSGHATVLQMPARQRRDTLELVDGVEREIPDGEQRLERKVA